MDFAAFGLPWEVLLTLAVGYAGYFVANVGVRAHHKSIDVTFSTIVYGFFGTAAYLAVLAAGLQMWVAVPAGFVVSMVAGGLWSAVLRDRFADALRHLNVSQNDDLPSALANLMADKKGHATQLSVRLTTGVWLMCNDLARFQSAPCGPCVLGPSGDVLMYVTHHRDADGDYEECEVDVPNWGMELTYIPANQVSRIDLRKRAISS
jgi:hypothetical protein